jgi:SAM-dependent methyltransferase
MRIIRTISKAVKKFSTRQSYRDIEVSNNDLISEEYKNHLGGGIEKWELRGQFQLKLLQQIGLKPTSKLFDIGCGPGRASKYIIEYLDSNNYCGIDYNSDFISIAKKLCENNTLQKKNPQFLIIDNFDFSHLDIRFDYILLFSVLQHVETYLVIKFFNEIQAKLRDNGYILITHAFWFDLNFLRGSGLTISKVYWEEDIDTYTFGWNKNESIFPILILERDKFKDRS